MYQFHGIPEIDSLGGASDFPSGHFLNFESDLPVRVPSTVPETRNFDSLLRRTSLSLGRTNRDHIRMMWSTS
jgi:hypothetical protein